MNISCYKKKNVAYTILFIILTPLTTVCSKTPYEIYKALHTPAPKSSASSDPMQKVGTPADTTKNVYEKKIEDWKDTFLRATKTFETLKKRFDEYNTNYQMGAAPSSLENFLKGQVSTNGESVYDNMIEAILKSGENVEKKLAILADNTGEKNLISKIFPHGKKYLSTLPKGIVRNVTPEGLKTLLSFTSTEALKKELTPETLKNLARTPYGREKINEVIKSNPITRNSPLLWPFGNPFISDEQYQQLKEQMPQGLSLSRWDWLSADPTGTLMLTGTGVLVGAAIGVVGYWGWSKLSNWWYGKHKTTTTKTETVVQKTE